MSHLENDWIFLELALIFSQFLELEIREAFGWLNVSLSLRELNGRGPATNQNATFLLWEQKTENKEERVSILIASSTRGTFYYNKMEEEKELPKSEKQKLYDKVFSKFEANFKDSHLDE